jgi:hypothetical protein
MSAALRILNNKRKSGKLSKSSEADVEDSLNSSSKSSAKKPRNRLRASSPPVESQLHPSNTISASSNVEGATPVAIQDQVSSLEATSQATEATLDSPPADSAIKHAPSMLATSSALSAIDTTSVASDTQLVVPVVSNNPLTITPSHGRFLLPTEEIERLSKKPTRAQVVQVTTNLKRDSCHYLPIDVVHPDNYDSFETLLMLQYVMNPSKMEECS